MDWVEEYIAKMDIHRGKKYFWFCDKSFGFTGIVLPCEQQKRYIFHPLYTSNTYAQEVDGDLYVPEVIERKQNTNQALAFFQRDLEKPLGEKCIFLGEAQDGTNHESVKGVKDSSTFLVDEYYPSFKLVHEFPCSTPFTTTTTHENGN